ncbi:MAG: GHKL domain-containing protein [Lachnospiraceae bacterium]|nr:GHKL domain-containing protein [Lachnospiraceae bacterium]
MNIIIQILQFLATIIEIGTAFGFYYWLMGTRPHRKWKWIVIGSVVAILSLFYFYNRQFWYFSNAFIISNTVFVWITICLVERKNYLRSIGMVFAFFSYIGLLHVFYGDLAMLLLADDKVQMERFYFGQGDWLRIAGYTMSLLTIVLIFLVIRKRRNMIRLWIGKWALLIYGIILWCASTWAQGHLVMDNYAEGEDIVVLVEKYKQLFKSTSYKEGVYIVVLVLILILVSFLLFSILFNYYMTGRELQIIKEKNDMWKTNYTEMKKVYENSLYTYHDFKNHMVVLRKYISDEDMDSARGYLDKIIKPLDELNQCIWCQNEIVNLVINTKILEAKKQNISFQVDIQDIGLQIEEYDLYCILSNLLDNAIEACEKMTEKTRWIHIKMHENNLSVIIKIANSIGSEPVKIAGEYVSHKAAGHGYGIKSVRHAVEKNGGIMNCDHDAGQFAATITFFR